MSDIAINKDVIYGVRHGCPDYKNSKGSLCVGFEHMDLFVTEKGADRKIAEWLKLFQAPWWHRRPEYVYKVRFIRDVHEERKS